MEEEKDLEVVDEESDFADEVKPEEPAPEEKKKEEEKPAERNDLGVNLYNEDNEVDPNFANGQSAYGRKKKGPVETFEYENDDLKNIEDARLEFAKKYKKRNIIKYVVTGIVLVGVILGWVLPNYLMDKETAGNWPTYITLIVFVVMLVFLGVYSAISKRKSSKEVNEYLAKYFENSTKYVLDGIEVQNLKGSINDKIEPKELTDSVLYKDIVKVGSRGKITFEYNNVPVTVVDCSASRQNGRNYATSFVGKMIKAANSWEHDPVIVYIKGNKRALPPTNLDGFEVVSDTKTMVVYGESKKKLLTQKTKEAISKIKTDKVLVDCAIAIRPGITYVMMGYEDSLMVPPFDSPFNPAPTNKYKEDLAIILEVVETLF